jgi:hypothetical protein
MAKIAVRLGMDDVPHLSEEEKEKVLSGVPPWQLESRKTGRPGMGAGSIYPIPESEIICAPFDIPMHWPRSYGLDPGWNRTAAIWFAWDMDNGGAVAYDEYYRGQADPAVHVSAINTRGKWIPGVIDPAAQAARGHAGDLLLDLYRDLGLNVEKADNAVVPGLVKCWDMLSTGQLRIFSTLRNTRSEMRLYRRNEKGDIIKANDHLMDAMRYNAMSGRAVAKVPPSEQSGAIPWFTYRPPLVWSG